MKAVLTLIIFGLLLIVLSLKVNLEHERDVHESEIRKYHSNYVRIYPFEGDESYEIFDSIFGHQDDEFYTSHQCVDVTHERCDGACECDGYECSNN